MPGGVQGHSVRRDDPISGLFLRTLRLARGAPRGIAPTPARLRCGRSRPVESTRCCAATPRSRPTPRDPGRPRLNVARLTAAARSFDGLGWYLGTSGVGLLYLPDGAAMPDRLPFGLR